MVLSDYCSRTSRKNVARHTESRLSSRHAPHDGRRHRVLVRLDLREVGVELLLRQQARLDHVLPGALLVRISMAKRENSPKIEANDMVMKALSLPAAESEFQSAKQIIFGAIQTGDVYDRWLDVDTFKIDSPSKWVEKALMIAGPSVRGLSEY